MCGHAEVCEDRGGVDDCIPSFSSFLLSLSLSFYDACTNITTQNLWCHGVYPWIPSPQVTLALSVPARIPLLPSRLQKHHEFIIVNGKQNRRNCPLTLCLFSVDRKRPAFPIPTKIPLPARRCGVERWGVVRRLFVCSLSCVQRSGKRVIYRSGC